MLLLCRRIGETIMIDGNKIKITLVGINRNQARLGIEAPPEISVHREEIWDRIQKEREMESHAE